MPVEGLSDSIADSDEPRRVTNPACRLMEEVQTRYVSKVEFNLSSIGGHNESLVNAESQTAAPKNKETSRCRSQAGQTAGEGGIGGPGREKGKGQEGKSEE